MTIQQIIAVVIFIVTMTAIMTEKVHRTVAAMTGAILLLVTGILSLDTLKHTSSFEDALSKKLLKMEGVTSVSYVSSAQEEMGEMLGKISLWNERIGGSNDRSLF